MSGTGRCARRACGHEPPMHTEAYGCLTVGCPCRAYLARQKHNAQRAECDVGGTPHVHDSLKERARHWELAQLEAAGQIRNLELVPRYDLVVNGQHIGRYRGDFRYCEQARWDDGALHWVSVTEDVKGLRTRDYLLRKRLMRAIHGIDIRET
jgi:hypothetical protein